MNDFAHTAYAVEQRTIKAVKIEAVLRMAGCTDAATAHALTDKDRRLAEKAAKVRRCSDETWGMVFDLLDSWRPHEVMLAIPEGSRPLKSGVRTTRTGPLDEGTPPCPACGATQGDPACCHNCDEIAYTHVRADRGPGLVFCSEICSLRHLVGVE